MIVPTGTSDARRSSAATPQHTSRSVTTPTSFTLSRFSTTGAQPQPESRMARAACAAVSCGVQHEDASIGFITSLQQLMVILISRAGFARPFAPCAPSMLHSFTRVCAIEHMSIQRRSIASRSEHFTLCTSGHAAFEDSAHPWVMEGALSLLLFAGLFYFMMRFGCGAHMVHGHGGHEGQQYGSGVAGSAIDPVCGMAVVADHGYTAMHQGRQHRFCSRACLDTFEAHRERYLTITEGVR